MISSLVDVMVKQQGRFAVYPIDLLNSPNIINSLLGTNIFIPIHYIPSKPLFCSQTLKELLDTVI